MCKDDADAVTVESGASQDAGETFAQRDRKWRKHLEESSIEQLASEFSMDRYLSDADLLYAISDKMPPTLTDEEIITLALRMRALGMPQELGEIFGKIAPFEVAAFRWRVYELPELRPDAPWQLRDIADWIGDSIPHLRPDFLPFLSVEWAEGQRGPEAQGTTQTTD